MYIVIIKNLLFQNKIKKTIAEMHKRRRLLSKGGGDQKEDLRESFMSTWMLVFLFHPHLQSSISAF
jgi:hypothetical protein